jgi:RimJ/RimL family protein N-acetyltransferase
MKIFLESERLFLREITPGDTGLLFQIHSDPEVMKFIRPPETTLAATEATLKKIFRTNQYEQGLGLWICHEKAGGAFIGWFVLKHLDATADVEIGYRLMKKYWGRGYATEMTKKLIGHGFETLGLNRIVGATHPENAASQHVLEKAGLTFARIQHVYANDARIYECFNPLKS